MRKVRLTENKCLAWDHRASKKQQYIAVIIECPPYIFTVSCITRPTFSRLKSEMPHLQTLLWIRSRHVTQVPSIKYTYVKPGFRRTDLVARAVAETSSSLGMAATEPLTSISEYRDGVVVFFIKKFPHSLVKPHFWGPLEIP